MGNNLDAPAVVAEVLANKWAASGHNWPGDMMIADVTRALQEREDDRQYAYHERYELVAFLSRLYPSHLARHPDSDATWDREWMTIVCIHMTKWAENDQSGVRTWCTSHMPPDEHYTMTWHVHDSEVPLFAHLAMQEDDWDGSDTATKYERLRRLP